MKLVKEFCGIRDITSGLWFYGRSQEIKTVFLTDKRMKLFEVNDRQANDEFVLLQHNPFKFVSETDWMWGNEKEVADVKLELVKLSLNMEGE